MDKKWTTQQKLLSICGVIGPVAAYAIMSEVAKIGSANSLKILKLTSEVGVEKTIRLLTNASKKVINLSEFRKVI